MSAAIVTNSMQFMRTSIVASAFHSIISVESSSPENHALTQHFYRRLDAAGLIEERTTRQIWSSLDQRFLPDRYVLGACPSCGSDQARGDQCDGCGRPLDPVDLIAPHSALSGDAALVWRESAICFFASRFW